MHYLHFDTLFPALARWLRHRVCFFRGPQLGYTREKFNEDNDCIYCGAPLLVIYG